MRKNNGNKAKLSVIALTLIACLMVAGVSAYFTDADTQTNTFTVGKISLDLQEPEWTEPKDILPEQEIKKDPQILNDGNNAEYVFMTVAVPYDNVITANEDGSENTAADTELFSYDVNTNWVEVTGEINGVTYPTKDTAGKTVTHLYAYGTKDAMTSLAKDATTPALFEYVRFANVVEDQDLEVSTLNVVINAYGIQTTDINDNDGIGGVDGVSENDKVAPADVFSVISKQAPSTANGDDTDLKDYEDANKPGAGA